MRCNQTDSGHLLSCLGETQGREHLKASDLYLGTTILNPLFVQKRQQHADDASQTWYMQFRLQYSTNAMVSCFAACSQLEWDRHVTLPRKCPIKAITKKRINICTGHGCLWQECMTVKAIVHSSSGQVTACDTGQGFRVLTDVSSWVL